MYKKTVYSRVDRINEILKRVIAETVELKLKDPRLGFVTIMRVKISKDLKFAKVYVSVMGNEDQQKETIEVLENARGFIKTNINKVLTLKYIPELEIVLDKSLDYSERINNLIKEKKDNIEVMEEKTELYERMKVFTVISDLINESDNIVVTSHSRPDGDSIGSVLAFSAYLEKLEKKHKIYLENECPEFLKWLPGTDSIVNNIKDEDINKIDTVVVLDACFNSRIGKIYDKLKNKSGLKIIVLDHHKNKLEQVTEFFIDPEKSSAGEILYNYFKYINFNIDCDTALNLYISILTDTDKFSQVNTTPETLEICSKLLRNITISPDEINNRIYESRELKQLKLMTRLIDTIKIDKNLRTAYGFVTREMFKETGTEEVDTEGFINIIRSLNDIDIAVMLRERKDGLVKVTLRSKTAINLLPVVRKYGGGGHERAAGFSTDKNLNEILDELIKELQKILSL